MGSGPQRSQTTSLRSSCCFQRTQHTCRGEASLLAEGCGARCAPCEIRTLATTAHHSVLSPGRSGKASRRRWCLSRVLKDWEWARWGAGIGPARLKRWTGQCRAGQGHVQGLPGRCREGARSVQRALCSGLCRGHVTGGPQGLAEVGSRWGATKAFLPTRDPCWPTWRKQQSAREKEGQA